MAALGLRGFGTSAYGAPTGNEASTSNAAQTPTTTLSAIIAQMVSVVRALTPVNYRDILYTHTPDETMDFRTWCEENPSGAFRTFQAEEFDVRLIGGQNFQVELRQADIEFVMAYPSRWGAYATKEATNTKNEMTARALIEEDLNLIAKTIGLRGGANYLDGQHAAVEEEWTIEQGEEMLFAVLPLTVTYYYNAS